MPTPDFSCMRSAPLEETIWLAATTGTVRPPIFLLRSAPPRGQAGKKAETVFVPVCSYRKQWAGKGKISIYIVKGIFSKVVVFKGTIRIFF
jgi:hypothetical protein